MTEPTYTRSEWLASGQPKAGDGEQAPAAATCAFCNAPSDETEDIGGLEVRLCYRHRAPGNLTAWDLSETAESITSGSEYFQPLRPSVGKLPNNDRLLYKGRFNVIAGDSTVGKTWTALTIALQELRDRRSVMILDWEEPDEISTTERMLSLGAEPELLRFLFHYSIDRSLDEKEIGWLGQLVQHLEPSLIVIDSVGASMNQQGLNGENDRDITQWHSTIVRRLLTQNTAILGIDHVTKTGGSSHHAAGSLRKRATLTAQYMQRTVRPFSKTQAGVAELVCSKDRHGTYALGQVVARLVVDPKDANWMRLEPGSAPAAAARTGHDDEYVILQELAKHPQGLSGNQLSQATGRRDRALTDARSALVASGQVLQAPRPGRGGGLIYRINPNLPNVPEGTLNHTSEGTEGAEPPIKEGSDAPSDAHEDPR